MEESIFAAAVTNCRVGRATAVLQCTAAITICRETAMDGRGVQCSTSVQELATVAVGSYKNGSVGETVK